LDTVAPVQLVEIGLAGFQSYRDEQRVRLEPDLTFLVGRNNVGKSALLRALLLWRQSQEGVRDGFRLAYRWIAEREELAAEIPQLTQLQGWSGFPHELSIEVVFTATSTGTIGAQQLKLSQIRFGDLAVAGGDDQSLLWAGQPSPANTRGIAGLENLARQLSDTLVYVAPRHIDIHPQGNVYEETKLAPDARNLANVLRHLREAYPTTKWRELMDFMKDAFPEIDDMTIPTVPDQSAPQGEPKIFYTGANDAVPLRLSGTGVQQLLSLATALVLADGKQLVLIDEPQAYLHPHAERALARLIAHHSQHQYILATHSSSLLATTRLSATRLLTLGENGTQCLDVDTVDAVLVELGVTAAELWLPDAILWVEGPSEQQVFKTLMAREADPAAYVGVAVRQVPAGASQFVGTNAKRAEAAYRFCEEAVAAIAPLPTTIRFLFDRDEKSPETVQRLTDVSGGSARFLRVRETENVFLEDSLVEAFIARQCEQFDLDIPGTGAVADRLAELVSNTADIALFPDGPPTDGRPLRDHVKGSRVLDMLCHEYLKSEYRKVEYAESFTRLALDLCPGQLEPFHALLSELQHP
jgi:AAA domain, putative AbiEii toxin, Type IV TA system